MAIYKITELLSHRRCPIGGGIWTVIVPLVRLPLLFLLDGDKSPYYEQRKLSLLVQQTLCQNAIFLILHRILSLFIGTLTMLIFKKGNAFGSKMNTATVKNFGSKIKQKRGFVWKCSVVLG